MIDSPDIRSIVYKSFDTYGIRVKPMARITLSFGKIDYENKKPAPEFILSPFKRVLIFLNPNLKIIFLTIYTILLASELSP